MKYIKKLPIIFFTSAFIYLCICLSLVYWPIPGKKDIENYDYSSLIESSQKAGLGKEQWVNLRDGFKLFCRVYESESKDTLILLHGSGSESRYLSRLASFLSSTGLFRVVTPDIRGHGRNEGRRGDIDYIGQLDDDIEDLFIHLKQTYSGTGIVLGGHSSGGGMALRYAGNDSVEHQPDGLLLFAPYLGHTSPTVKPNSGEWVTVALKRWIGLAMLNNIGITGFNKLPVLFFNRPDKVNDALQTSSYSYRMAINFSPNNYIDDIKKIRVPTLVLVGENDESFYPTKFEEVFEPSKKYVNINVIPGANHMNVIDLQESRDNVLQWYNEKMRPAPDLPADL